LLKPLTKKPIIVILGPTASGKSGLAVKLAKNFNGEVISADSRQVYKNLNIGTGKLTLDTKNSSNFSMGQVKKKYTFIHKGISHHCIDIASPKKIFTVIDFKKCAEKAIKDILNRGKIPIVCGGTGFYIQAITNGIIIPEVKPDWELRKKLEKKPVEELFKILKKLNPKRAKNIDAKNPRRLIRAIEIARAKPSVISHQPPKAEKYLFIGIKLPKKELKSRIEKRVKKMIKMGLENEVKNLVKKYGWIPALQTIGYQEWRDYFDKKINKERVKELIIQHTVQYAKRQMTWFKKYFPMTKWLKKL
jgi:tRNA dimethylallyltransferase